MMKLKLREDRLYFWPISGAGQIGRNLNLYGYRGEWIIVDWGVSFNPGFGVDVVFPDYTIIKSIQKSVKACIITHAHEDHIGALPHFWKDVRCPIYTTPFTAGMLKYQFNDNGVSFEEKDINVVEWQKDLSLSEHFTARFVPLNHSIPDASGVYLRTPSVKVFHTGDWRIDNAPVIGERTTEKDLEFVRKTGVDVLVCDSTSINVFEATGTETDVAENIMKLFSEHKKRRIFVSCFASNVGRMVAVGRAARKHKRKICLLGRSFQKTYSVAQELGYLKDFPDVVSPQEAAEMPADKIAFVCSGSQGEARAALWGLSTGRHRFVSLRQDDLILFSSRNIPGNERRIADLKNQLELKGARVIGSDQVLIHVAGHPSREDVETMYRWTKPKMLMPVHGEHYHLGSHKIVAEGNKMQALHTQNGHLYECSDSAVEMVMQADAKTFGMDGKRMISMDSSVMQEREWMSQHGVITLSVSKGGKGDRVAVGQLGVWDDEALDKDLAQCVQKVLSSHKGLHGKTLTHYLCVDTRKWVEANTGKRPRVVVLMHSEGGGPSKGGNNADKKRPKKASKQPVSDDVGNVAVPEKKEVEVNENIGNTKKSAPEARSGGKKRSQGASEAYSDILASYED